jgi:hypothetical protein
MKLFAYEKFKARSEKKGQTGITRGLAVFIGVAEVAGGIGIVLPMATNIAPSVSMLAAVGLSCSWQLAFRCAATSRWSHPASFSCGQCLSCSGVFLASC